MPTLIYTTPISGYSDGYTVTVSVDTAQVAIDFEVPYDHIELQDYDGNTVQSSTGSTVLVTDTRCIYFDGVYSVGYALYCLVEGSPARMFYSANPNAITASATSPAFGSNRLVLPLQDGTKSAMRMEKPSTSDKVVIVTQQDGTKVSKPLYPCSVGDVVTVVSLQDGLKAALKNETYTPETFVNSVTISSRNCVASRINILSGQTFQVRVTMKKYAPSTNNHRIRITSSAMSSPPTSSTKDVYAMDIPYINATYTTPIKTANANTSVSCNLYIQEGVFLHISKVEVSISGSSWITFLPDGDFSLGSWSTSCTNPGFVKTPVGSGTDAQYVTGGVESIAV